MESKSMSPKPKRKYTTVSIPKTLFSKIKARIEDTGFSSVSDYVTYVLREIFAEEAQQSTEKAFSSEDEKRVKDRLRALGYLD
jgi:Arc/MetJ-type ribon-helix-helix transcriptional regulator